MILKHWLLPVLALFVLGAPAEEYAITVRVGPGDNGGTTITSTAAAGDTLTVTVKPKDCYAITECNVDDSAGLGWVKAGDCVFTLTVKAGLNPSSTHKARFYGKLTRTCGGEGSGGKSEPLDWTFEGRFRVLGDCEGVECAMDRSPKGALTSSKPGGAPMDQGEATYNADSGQFDGTLQDDSGGSFLGLYEGSPIPDVKTAKGIQVGEVTEKPCPEDSTRQVKVVQIGSDDQATKIGGMAIPDRISINAYDGPQAAAWAGVRAGTLVHEEGHRRICHEATDALTEALNQVVARGWAPTEARARTLARIRFSKCWNDAVIGVQRAHRERQAAYEKATSHGQTQDQWAW